MRVHVLRREQRLPASPQDVFAFFAEARNLEAITPPWLGFRVVSPGRLELGVGTLIQYRLRLHGVALSWLTSIQAWEPPVRFADQQVRGPYALWHHVHEFEPVEDGRATVMRDTVHYAIGFGVAGELADRLLVRRDLDRIFDFRAEAVPALLAGG